MTKRKIGIIIGSESDLPQCYDGLEYLIKEVAEGEVEVLFVHVTSVHRHTDKLLGDLRKLSELPTEEKPDALIIGAGRANHLTGVSDAFLRNVLRDEKIVVYGVAFADSYNKTHAEAAILSITEVPDNQIVFYNYVGSMGFLQACSDAIYNELPGIKLPTKSKPCLELTLQQAYNRSCELLEQKEEK